jgi:hypothetical protein
MMIIYSKYLLFSAIALGIWVALPLIIQLGQKDVSRVVPMLTQYIDHVWLVSEFVKKYEVDESTFRSDNGITDDRIQPGRWVVYPRQVR